MEKCWRLYWHGYMPPYRNQRVPHKRKMGNPVFLTGLPLQEQWRKQSYHNLKIEVENRKAIK
jgi:hypothetical protein